jgi:hypothetical protein
MSLEPSKSLHAVAQEDTVFTYRCYNGREKPCRFRQTWAHFAAIHTEELNLPTVGPTTLQLHGF